MRKEDYKSLSRAESAAVDAEARAKWKELEEEDKELWRFHSRTMIASSHI